MSDDILKGGTAKSSSVPSATSKIDDDIKDLLNMSEDQVEEIRQKKLTEIENKIKCLKEKVNKDDLDNYVLENKIELLEKAKYMLDEYMVSVISQLSTVPRAYDVLAQMFTMVSGLNQSVTEKSESVEGKKEDDDEMDQKRVLQDTNALIGELIEQNMTRHNEKLTLVGKER